MPVLGQGGASLLGILEKLSTPRILEFIVYRHLSSQNHHFEGFTQFADTLPSRHIFPTTPILASARVSGICVASGSTSQLARSGRVLFSPRLHDTPSQPRCLVGAFYLDLLFDEHGLKG